MTPDHLSLYITTAAEVGLVYVLWHERVKYLDEQRSRRLRVAINLEIVDPRQPHQPVYGLEKSMTAVADLIDRMRDPEAYSHIRAGNEMLIVGPAQTGKKALAMEIARAADLDRAIIVHNPRDADALAEAKKLIDNHLPPLQRLWRAAGRLVTRRPPSRDLLLLPSLNEVNGQSGEAWLDQLEALIETASKKPNVLVVGTTDRYEPTGNVASWFGTVIELPKQGTPEWQAMMKEVAESYLKATQAAGYKLDGIEPKDFIERTLKQNPTPAEIQDIFSHCQTQATHRQKQGERRDLGLTSEILDTAIGRVIRPATSPAPIVAQTPAGA